MMLVNSWLQQLRQWAPSELVLHPLSDATELVCCYDETLTMLLDKFVPLQKVRSNAWPSATLCDADCWRSKAKTRKLEKAYSKKPSNESRLAWWAQFADQHVLFQIKLWHYWRLLLTPVMATPWHCGQSCGTWCIHTLTLPIVWLLTISQYFVTKIEWIWTSTSASSPLRIGDQVVSELLSEFQPVTTDEIATILLKSPLKQCLLDTAPTWLIKQSSDIISPVITAICNASFNQVTFLHCCKKGDYLTMPEEAKLRPQRCCLISTHLQP